MVLTIETNKSLSDESMNCLAKLKHLKSLKISTNSYYLKITVNGINQITENCVHIKSLTLKSLPNDNTEKLIEMAYSNPRICC